MDLLFWGAFALVSGLPMAVRPIATRLKAQRKHEDRLSEIDAGANERYFEERRALIAYPPPQTDSKTRWVGYGLTVAGIVLLILGISKG